MRAPQLALPGLGAPAPTKLTLFEDPAVWPGKVWKQPYAGLMLLAALGYDAKTIETRKSGTVYRGPLVGVAGLERDAEAFDRFDAAWLHERGIPVDAYRDATAHRGEAIFVMDLAEVRPFTEADAHRACISAPGRKVWMPSRLRVLVPFKQAGAQGFVRVPRERAREALVPDLGRFVCPGCGKRLEPVVHPGDHGPRGHDGGRLTIDEHELTPRYVRATCVADAAGPGCGRTWRACGCRTVVAAPPLRSPVCERDEDDEGVCDCGCAACPFEAAA